MAIYYHGRDHGYCGHHIINYGLGVMREGNGQRSGSSRVYRGQRQSDTDFHADDCGRVGGAGGGDDNVRVRGGDADRRDRV